MTSEDSFAAGLIRHAAHRVPAPLNERLEEEWLADLAGRRGHWQRLGLAFGCLWATRVITAEHLATASTTAVVATRGDTVALSSGPSVLSRRTIVLLMIVSIHALLLYGFISGLPRQIAHALVPTVAYTFDPPKVQRPYIDVLVPPPNIGHTKIDTLKVDPIHIDDVTESTVISSAPADTGALTARDLPSPPPVHHVGGPGPRFPATEDFYPAASRRAAEQGTSTIRVCVDSSGRLTGEPQLSQSSGIERLDDGALRLARAGSGYYRSTLENGQPIADCYPVRIRFILKR